MIIFSPSLSLKRLLSVHVTMSSGNAFHSDTALGKKDKLNADVLQVMGAIGRL